MTPPRACFPHPPTPGCLRTRENRKNASKSHFHKGSILYSCSVPAKRKVLNWLPSPLAPRLVGAAGGSQTSHSPLPPPGRAPELTWDRRRTEKQNQTKCPDCSGLHQASAAGPEDRRQKCRGPTGCFNKHTHTHTRMGAERGFYSSGLSQQHPHLRHPGSRTR